MTASTFLLVVVIAVGAELFAVWLSRKGQCCKEQTALLNQILQTDQKILAALQGQPSTQVALNFTFGQPVKQ